MIRPAKTPQRARAALAASLAALSLTAIGCGEKEEPDLSTVGTETTAPVVTTPAPTAPTTTAPVAPAP